MQPLKSHPQPARNDPAPSLWAWRMQRLMLTPLFRLGLRVGVPFILTFGLVYVYLSNSERQTAIADKIMAVRESIQDRPEFMMNVMNINGVDAALEQGIRTHLAITFPISSFELNLEDLRKRILNLSSVKEATLQVRSGGVLQVDVTPRIPVAIWRNRSGLSLVDVEGTHVSKLSLREDRADLPLIAGEGANGHVVEAIKLMAVAQPLDERLQGVVRMGMRRWDIVLDRDQRILLPTYGAIAALERVVALEGAQKVLSRDTTRIDMRLTDRPTIQMSEEAQQELRRMRRLTESGQ